MSLISGIIAGVLQTSQASDAAGRAKRQERDQKALQQRSLTEERAARDREKSKKKAADAQAEVEASLAADAASGQTGTQLGSAPLGKTLLGL
jgi:hypothetical protein